MDKFNEFLNQTLFQIFIAMVIIMAIDPAAPGRQVAITLTWVIAGSIISFFLGKASWFTFYAGALLAVVMMRYQW